MIGELEKFLKEKGIPYELYELGIIVDDNLLRPYEKEVKELFPGFYFTWEIQPNRSTDDENLEI